MPQNRREFFKIVAYGGLFSLGGEIALAETDRPRPSQKLDGVLQFGSVICKPLDPVKSRTEWIYCDGCTI
jgi:hypothetical protein